MERIGRRWVMFILMASTMAVSIAGCADSTDPRLDGTAEIDEAALAELAFERARLGAQWLAGDARKSGAFYYIYDPVEDTYDESAYNEVRHAGTTYALFQVYGATRDEELLRAGERAIDAIDYQSQAVEGSGRAFVYEDRTKLGGQALALVALLERRRVTQDTSYDELIDDLATFLLSMEIEEEPGRYYQSYEAPNGRRLLEPDSDYYPGEALLALTRLAQHFPQKEESYLEAARRAADYLIHERDGDIPAAGKVPREDHWLAIALSDLYRLNPDQDYITVAYLQADTMIDRQHKADEQSRPELVGASQRGPHNATAPNGEALVAVWGLAVFLDDEEAIERVSTASRRSAQFQMRVQYTEENTQDFPRPERAIGAWGMSPADPSIRIDYVQHNISGLIGVWYLTEEGDLPVAEPIA